MAKRWGEKCGNDSNRHLTRLFLCVGEMPPRTRFFSSAGVPPCRFCYCYCFSKENHVKGLESRVAGGVDRKVFVTHRTPRASWISYLLNYFKLRRRDASANHGANEFYFSSAGNKQKVFTLIPVNLILLSTRAT